MTLNPPPQSICILRLSAIGDVCHAVATVQALQRQYPETKITWVIGKIEAQLLATMQGVEFVIFDKKAGLKGYRALYSTLKGRKFDILLHMQVALRASLATLCISAKQTWGFDRSRAKEGQWLFTNRKTDVQKEPHVADGFFGFGKAIGLPAELEPNWQMPIIQTDRDWAKQHTGEKGYMVISPAASKEDRNWISDRYAAVANYAHEKGLQVILCGAPTKTEKKLAKEIIKFSRASIINLVGKTTLPQLLAVLENARFLIAPDSGPAHMATTVNTPVIGLYAHSNPMRTGPYHSQSLVVSVYQEVLLEQTGKSIAENPWGKRVKGKELMSRIKVRQVTDKIDSILVINQD